MAVPSLFWCMWEMKLHVSSDATNAVCCKLIRFQILSLNKTEHLHDLLHVVQEAC